MFVLGMDIGYSNLKLAMGEKGGEVTTKVRPAGAGPIELMPRNCVDKDFVKVLLDGKQWVAGIEPSRLEGVERELHRNYKATSSYKALFHAALLLSERDVIDVLVTGLPVDQANDEEQCSELISMLKGTHQVTTQRAITVKEVRVVAQPAGAYLDCVMSQDDEETLEIFENGRAIVIDPGFYSVDWVVVQNGEIYHRSSGTSLKAMSRLLEVAGDLIADDFGETPRIEDLERTIRNQKSLFVLSKKVDLHSYIKSASKIVAKEALTTMRQTLRDNMNIDIVILAGGGASTYEEAAIEVFPCSKVISTEDHVLSNARGFFHYA